MKEPRQSRRRFLKKIAFTGAGVLGSGGLVNAVAPLALPEERVYEPNRSHWAKALPAASAPLAADMDADVVVVGGGFTGLSCAYYLRKSLPGKRIALLEASVCGNGASGRNGAMVLTMTESSYMRLSDHPTVDRRLYEVTAGNIRTLEALAIEHGVDCELERNGAVQTLDSNAQLTEARMFCARARDLGFPFEFWNREQTAAIIGTNAYAGSLFDPGGAQVHPGKLVGLWKAAAMRAGVEIYDATPVIDIQESAIHEITTAAQHRVRTPVLVLATNAYTSRLGYLRRAVAPIYDYVAITPVLSEAQIESAGWKVRIPFNDSRTEVYYAGLTRDRRIHFGGGTVDYSFNNGVRDRPQAAARYAALHREFARLFPGLSGVGFESAWSGSVDMSLNGSPAVGVLGRHGNIFYGIGFSGHGVNLTSVFGRIIADLVAKNGEQWAWLPFLNRLPPYVPNEPFRWLGIQADLIYTRWTQA